MGMNLLDGIKCRVIPNSDMTISVLYEHGEFSGSVMYHRYEMGNLLMRGKPIYLMVTCDMGDIIELIHQLNNLTSEDFTRVNMDIRNHSRDMVISFMSQINESEF